MFLSKVQTILSEYDYLFSNKAYMIYCFKQCRKFFEIIILDFLFLKTKHEWIRKYTFNLTVVEWGSKCFFHFSLEKTNQIASHLQLNLNCETFHWLETFVICSNRKRAVLSCVEFQYIISDNVEIFYSNVEASLK
jgi:hypothetical protein